jgi:hypothetical protein
MECRVAWLRRSFALPSIRAGKPGSDGASPYRQSAPVSPAQTELRPTVNPRREPGSDGSLALSRTEPRPPMVRVKLPKSVLVDFHLFSLLSAHV